MKPKNQEPLRASAEARLAHAQKQKTKVPQRSGEELLHELQVHQIELEMQNEHLQHALLALEESFQANLDCMRLITDDKPPVVRITLTDITSLHQSKVLVQQLGSLLQDSFNEIYMFDADSLKFILTSEGAKKNLGYSEDELRKLTPLDLKLLFTRESFEQLVAPLRSSDQQILFFETIHRRKDGATYPVEVRLQLMHEDYPVFLAIVQDITERKQAEQQLRDLTAHLQSVREDEKASVAREIHDDLGGTLTSLKMETYWLKTELSKDKGATPLLDHVWEISKLIDHASGVMRSIITGLRPTILDDLGLLAALEWQATRFQKHTGIKCRVNCVCAGNDNSAKELDKPRSIALFRISQEALANVVKHSGASEVEIEFHHGDEEIIMSIIDNGCGLTEKRTDAAIPYGILGMCERVDQLGGKISFDTPPGGGFNVTVILPLLAKE